MQLGDWVDVQVFKITAFGAFVRMPNKKRGLIHISQVSDNFIKDIDTHLKVGERLKAKIINVTKDGKIDLTLRKEPNRSKVKPGAIMDKNKDKGGDYFRILPFEDKLVALEF